VDRFSPAAAQDLLGKIRKAIRRSMWYRDVVSNLM